MTPPKINSPNDWQAATADTAAKQIDALWYERFNSSELNSLVIEAVRNSHDLKAATARVLEAEATAKTAGAALFPTVSAGFSAERSVHQVPGAANVSSNAYSGNLSASYQLDLFGLARDQAASANRRLEASLYDRETVTITLISGIVTDYLQVLSARERQQITADRLKSAAVILQVLESQRRVGTLSDLEVAQQRSALATEQAELPTLRLAERQSLNALAILLGRSPQGFTVEGKSLSDVILPSVAAGIPSTVLLRRPDLRSAEASLRSANFDVAAARAARLPSIQLTAAGGSASSAFASLFSTGTFLYSAAGSVSETLFAGGRLQGAEQDARARYLELSENYQQSVISAFSDVENALAAVEYDGEQYKFANEASTQADLAYHLAELRYRSGTVDFQTVLNAQIQAFQAQESMVQGQLARFTAVIGLTQALGGGWDGATPETPPLSMVSQPL